MQIQLANYAYRRGNGLIPRIRLENVYPERSPAELKTGVAILTRPTLDSFGAYGTDGPNRGIFWKKDVFGDRALAVQGSSLIGITEAGVGTTIGSVAGSSPVKIAFSQDTALIATGGPLLQTDGSTVTAKAFPLDQNVIAVGYINGYFLAVPENSQRIYFTDPLDGEFADDRFIAAERYPDNLRDLVVTSDEIWALGAASTEVFVPTGVDDAENPPFQRVDGRLFRKGLINAATVASVDNTIFWVGTDEQESIGVFRGEAVPVAINDESIAERLERANPEDLKAWAFGHAKHIFVVLAMGAEGTAVFDVLTGVWLDWGSYQRDQWRAHLGCGCWPGVTLAGDDETNTIWRLSYTGTTDDGAPVVQVWTAGVSVPLVQRRADGGASSITNPANSNLFLECAVGQAAISLENIPVIELRISDDQGRTWTDPDPAELGAVGEYDTIVQWTRLGSMRPPARIYEWTCSDPVRMRVSAARINE